MSKSNRKSSNKRGLRIFLIILLVLLIIAVIFFSTVLGLLYSKLSKIQHYELGEVEVNEGVAEQLKGYRNIAVFGVDARADRFTNTRSDIIMIVSLNQDTKEVKIT